MENGSFTDFLRGTLFTALVALFALAVGIIQVGQGERDAFSSNSANATIAAIQQEQLSVLKEISTLQANSPDSDFGALMSTMQALDEEEQFAQATSQAFLSSWRTRRMSDGLSGPSVNNGVWFGPYETYFFNEEDRNSILRVSVNSYGHYARIELWEGHISPSNSYWWENHRLIAQSDGTGSGPIVVINPQLEWRVVPGEYTVFFAGFSADGKVQNHEISYIVTKE